MAKEKPETSTLEDESLSEAQAVESEMNALKEAGETYMIKAYHKPGGKLKVWKGNFDHVPDESEILDLHLKNPDWWELGSYELQLIVTGAKGGSAKRNSVRLNVGEYTGSSLAGSMVTQRPEMMGKPKETEVDYDQSFRDPETQEIFYLEAGTKRTYIKDPKTGAKIYDKFSRFSDDDEEQEEGIVIRPETPIRGKDDLFMLMLRQQQIDAKRSTEQQSDMFKFMMQMNQQNMQMLVTVLSQMGKNGGNLDIGNLMSGMSNMLGTFKGLVGGGGEVKEGGGLMDMIGAVAPIIQSLIEAGKTPQQAVQEVQTQLQAGQMPKAVPAPSKKQIDPPAEEVKAVEKEKVEIKSEAPQKSRSERKAEREAKKK